MMKGTRLASWTSARLLRCGFDSRVGRVDSRRPTWVFVFASSHNTFRPTYDRDGRLPLPLVLFEGELFVEKSFGMRLDIGIYRDALS